MKLRGDLEITARGSSLQGLCDAGNELGFPLKVIGKKILPFYFDTTGRIRPRLADKDRVGEGHFGHTLSVFADTGIPLSTPISVASPSKQLRVRDALRELASHFEPGLSEPGFASVTLASYVAPSSSWKNHNEDTVTLQDVLRDLLDREVGDGVCSGTHVLQGVTRLVMLDRSRPFLTGPCRDEANQYLRDAAARLVRNQSPLGGWSNSWNGENEANPDPLSVADKLDFLQITAHHLEWISICDDDLRPPAQNIEKAIMCCMKLLEITPSHELLESICPPVDSLRCVDLATNFELSQR